MSKNFYGSIDLTLLLEAAKEGHDGLAKSDKNNHIYANITVWENDEIDKYGNILSIQVNEAKDSTDFKKFYIGNCKPGKQVDKTLKPEDINNLRDTDDLPF